MFDFVPVDDRLYASNNVPSPREAGTSPAFKTAQNVADFGSKFGSYVHPVIGAAATAASAGLSWYGAKQANIQSRDAAERQMAFQREMAQDQMSFQKEMSNTSFQRRMEDMRKAGINPILAFQQGGASTPLGASASGAKPDIRNEYAGAVSSALGMMRVDAELRNMRAQNALLNSQTALNLAQASRVSPTREWIGTALDAISTAAGVGYKGALASALLRKATGTGLKKVTPYAMGDMMFKHLKG